MRAQSVYGPPGTGKTTHLMALIDRFKNMGYDASQISLLSHTKAAAAEALSRLGVSRSDLVSTIHSQCYRLLDMSSSQIVDFRRLNEFSELMGISIKNGSVDSEEGIEVGDEYLAIYNRSRNRMRSYLDEYEESDRPGTWPEFQAFCHGYADWKKSNGYIDFTDMLERLVNRGDQIQFSAKVLLVDEAQDLSPLQWAVIDILIRNVDWAVAAGDDDQAVHTWAGADAHGMAAFEERFDAKRLILDQSHRVPIAVHQLALDVIGRVANRVEKRYLPKDSVGIVNNYGGMDSVDFKHGEDTLVLCRTGAQKKEVEKILVEQGIPYLNDGGKPGMYQTKIYRAIQIYHRLQNGDAVSPSEMQLLNDQSEPRFKSRPDSQAMAEFLRVGHMKALKIPFWNTEFFRNVDVNVAPTIRISSIHGAKGREAERVILHTGMTQRTAAGMDSNMDSECRVWYVGVTRAKNRLDIVDGNNPFPLQNG